MSCIELAVVGPVKTYRQKMRCCYPEQNRAMNSPDPTGWIAVGGDHDTRLQKEKLGPSLIESWKYLEGPQIPIRLFSSRTVDRMSNRSERRSQKRIRTYFNIDEYCVWCQITMH